MKSALKRYHLIFTAISAITLVIAASISVCFAEECFYASGKVPDDAQSIRLTAHDMGWHINKPVSLSAASIIRGKVWLYPLTSVEVCLLDNDELLIRIQALSNDAEKAVWHKLLAASKAGTEED